ncbi:hypothetical protein OIV83_001961 [Microbotryomycetes sp. JL201]|nr:hypothetical protein OIV83_001961 [Microbotryomycetes sp. JL201]
MSYAGMPPSAMMQQQQHQQQQRMHYNNANSAAAAAAAARHNAAAMAMAQQQQQQQQQHGLTANAVPAAPLGAPDEVIATTDVFDVVNARQLASHRFLANHDLMSSTLDPWSVDLILEGSRRKREVQDMIRASRSTLGVPGMAVGPLTALACSATRLTPVGDLASNVTDDLSSASGDSQRLGLEDRRARLQQMKAQIEQDTVAMQTRMLEAEARFKRTT